MSCLRSSVPGSFGVLTCFCGSRSLPCPSGSRYNVDSYVVKLQYNFKKTFSIHFTFPIKTNPNVHKCKFIPNFKLVSLKHHQAPFEQVIEPGFGVVSGRGGCVPGGPVECAVGGDDGGVEGDGGAEVRELGRIWREGGERQNMTFSEVT